MGRRIAIFLGAGAVLLALDLWVWTPLLAESTPAPRDPIVITWDEVKEIREGWAKTTGHPPTPTEESALISRRVDEAVMFREAVALGLHRSDPVVYRRLVQNMRFIEGEETEDDEELYQTALELGMADSDPLARRYIAKRVELILRRGVPEETDAAVLNEYLEANADKFAIPTRVRFHQVFVSRDRHSDPTSVAESLQSELPTEVHNPADVRAIGDPTALPFEMPPSTEPQIAKRFGPGFAEAVVAMPVGGWHGPVASAYGVHWVWIDERLEERLPALSEVLDKVKYSLRKESEKTHVRERLDTLREHYEVIVETEAPPEGDLS